MPKQVKLSPEMKAVLEAFKEQDDVIKLLCKAFGRTAQITEQVLVKLQGLETEEAPQGLHAVPNEPNDVDAIASAQAALGLPKETVQ
jgi:hypothetical protein